MAESCWWCCLTRRYANAGFSSLHTRLLDGPEVQLDTTRMGYGVVVVKNGQRICGTGAALANAPIAQNKAYFEVKLQSSGMWGVGVATRNCDVQTVPLGCDTDSWVLRHDGSLCHNNTECCRVSPVPEEGDIVGMSYDHVELKIYVNGRPTDARFTGIRGTIFPVMYVDDGAILDTKFSRFYHEPPNGFEEIMIEKSLL